MTARDHRSTATTSPPRHVLAAFAGDLVFTPCGEATPAEVRCSAQAMEALAQQEFVEFRVPPPARSRTGELTVDGWSATHVLEGEPHAASNEEWPRFFAAARAFNEVLRDLERPDFLDARTGRQALADQVAFGEAEYPDPIAKSSLLLDALLSQRRPCVEPSQTVHGELAGHVLFAAGFPPTVTGFAPYWRPAGFSLALAAIDTLLWHDAPVAVLESADAAADSGPEFADHLIRALICRMVALNESVKADSRPEAEFAAEVDAGLERFDLVYDLVKEFQAAMRIRADRPFDAVLCDIDGVVRRWPSIAPVEAAHGLPPGTHTAVAFAPHRLLPAVTGEVTDEEWRSAIASDLVDGGYCADLAAAQAFVAEWSAMRSAPDEDVIALLQLARELMPVALVSNGTTRLEADLKHLGLSEFVDDLVNTCRIGFAKPDPRVYAHAAQQVGVPAQRCLFVDDSWENVEAAREVGMSVVHFREAADLEEALRPLFPFFRRSAPVAR